LQVRLIVIKKTFSINKFNIYAKTVHKEYRTPHELGYTQLHQLGGLRERWKLPQRGLGRRPESSSFNSVFIDKKAHLKIY